MADSLKDAEREEWERTRYLAYVTAQVQNTKKLKPTDVLKLDWDNESKGGNNEKTTKEQFEEYKKKMGF